MPEWNSACCVAIIPQTTQHLLLMACSKYTVVLASILVLSTRQLYLVTLEPSLVHVWPRFMVTHSWGGERKGGRKGRIKGRREEFTSVAHSLLSGVIAQHVLRQGGVTGAGGQAALKGDAVRCEGNRVIAVSLSLISSHPQHPMSPVRKNELGQRK